MQITSPILNAEKYYIRESARKYSREPLCTMKIGMFKRKTRAKHLQQFGLNVANLLTEELPGLKAALELSEIHSIHFTSNQESITVISKYNSDNHKSIKQKHNTCFRLHGIMALNKSTNIYEEIGLFYHNDTLSQVTVHDAQYFHSKFDLNSIKKGSFEIESVVLQNPDSKIAEKLVMALSEDQKRKLDIETSFEIEFNSHLYYTILDMEDGNYIAIDVHKKIYSLNHDNEPRIELIAESPVEFFSLYSGNKAELKVLFNK